jgi:hypothetical protein
MRYALAFGAGFVLAFAVVVLVLWMWERSGGWGPRF